MTSYHGSDISYRFVGLDNYNAMLQDPTFWTSLSNTLFFVVLLLPSSLVLSLALAVLLNQRIPFQTMFRTLYYLPVISPWWQLRCYGCGC